MYSRLDDILALIGAGCILAGVYLLVGLAPSLILFGSALVFVGWRIDVARAVTNEPDQNIIQ